jgi:SAM-dependent methyltransferase
MRWGSFLAMLRSSRLRGPAVRALPPSNESPAQMARTAATAYSADLASIHDAGFGHVAANAAVELLKHLRKSRKRATPGLVVDVGCGSGILAQAVSAAGYDVLGFDYSEAMLAIARRRAPRAEFRRESFISAAVPPCIAIAAVGEVFNYLFDRRNRASRLPRVLRNLYQALEPGGLLLFDVATPGRVPRSAPTRGYSEGPGWTVLFTAEEDHRRMTLTRTITSFWKIGDFYRRSREIHRLRLYPRNTVVQELRNAGFQVRPRNGYGRFRFPPGWVGFAATKPRR